MSNTKDDEGYSVVALDALSGLACYWCLTLEQQSVLIGAPHNVLTEWIADPEHARLGNEHQRRILLLCGIYSDLHSLYGDVPAADSWPHRANHDFGGRTPLARMLEGADGLEEVAAYTCGMVA